MSEYNDSIDLLIRTIADSISVIKGISMEAEIFGLDDFHRARLIGIRGALMDAVNSPDVPRTVRVMAQEAVRRADATLL